MNQLTTVFLDGNIKTNRDLQKVTRASTLALLQDPNLTGTGKGQVITFLSEIGLITVELDSKTKSRKTTEPVISLSGAKLEGAKLEGAKLYQSNLYRAYLENAYLENADLRGANLSGANLSGANLSGANLSGANLSGANLSGANLRGTVLDDSTQIEKKWRLVQRITTQGAVSQDLRRANLRRANLSGADLRDANLSGAYLSDADLNFANLHGAKVQNAHFGGGLGLSDAERQALARRGAIFNEASGDRESAYSPVRR